MTLPSITYPRADCASKRTITWESLPQRHSWQFNILEE